MGQSFNTSHCTKTYYLVPEHLINAITEYHFIIHSSCLVKLVKFWFSKCANRMAIEQGVVRKRAYKVLPALLEAHLLINTKLRKQCRESWNSEPAVIIFLKHDPQGRQQCSFVYALQSPIAKFKSPPISWSTVVLHM